MKIFGILITAVIMTLYASAGQAWNVTITNKCAKSVRLLVKGDHLFWRSIDCVLEKVPSGNTMSCSMPGGICPVAIILSWKKYLLYGDVVTEYEEKSCAFGGIACCWDVIVEAYDGAVVDGDVQCSFKFK